MEASLLTGETRRTLETFRILNETIAELRRALEGSRKELFELRSKSKFLPEAKTRIRSANETETVESAESFFIFDSMDGKIMIEREGEDGTEGETRDGCKVDSETEMDDIDDIELVFTTGETDPNSIHEDLVPIVEETSKASSVVETDISKCGVLDEHETAFSARRNTLPDPVPYQPMAHRDVFAAARKAPVRSPIRRTVLPGTQDTSVQTDITALPTQWKSETYLSHKMTCNLTTLPSKFALPVPQGKRLPLSDKTCEARRVLLSDINFTSMVPELSRSADRLHDERGAPKNGGSDSADAKTAKTENRCDHSRLEIRSSCCGGHYGSRCHASFASMPPFACEESCRRHSWKPANHFCCRWKNFPWSSVPSSPGRDDSPPGNFCFLQPRRRKAKVSFRHCDPCGRSMPNLVMDGPDSGDSTDSLLDETEEFLRRSIDKLMIGTKRRERRLSDADSISGFVPPQTAHPFLPKTANDLKRDSFVKVITPDGRIVGGRVRYSGAVPGGVEPYVGVELANDAGFSDGTFVGHHFFNCEPGHAVFVPFKKVVIAWDV